MESKAIFVSLIAVFLLISLASIVVADIDDLNVTIATTVSGVELDGLSTTELAILVGDTLPVRVQLTAEEDVTDAVLEVKISGEDSEVQTSKFDMINGRTYSKLLNLKVPDSIDAEESEDLILIVSVESKEGDIRESYPITLQREADSLKILNVEVENTGKAGSVVNLDIVIKNRGSHRADDVFVVASIPSLGIERRAYFGDLTPVDSEDDDEDAAERRLFLSIPSNAQAGIYTLEVEAYSDDAKDSVTRNIVISGFEEVSQVLTSVTSKDVAKGGSISYELIIVNSGSNIAVYDIIPETSEDLRVSVDQPILTIPAGSSRVITVNVVAGDTIGKQSFAVNVESNGQLVERVGLTANVVSKTASIGTSSNIVILTVVLAIIFVVLLVVLIVLISRKPERVEEFGESYY